MQNPLGSISPDPGFSPDPCPLPLSQQQTKGNSSGLVGLDGLDGFAFPFPFLSFTSQRHGSLPDPHPSGFSGFPGFSAEPTSDPDPDPASSGSGLGLGLDG